jgi:hypothetical protein
MAIVRQDGGDSSTLDCVRAHQAGASELYFRVTLILIFAHVDSVATHLHFLNAMKENGRLWQLTSRLAFWVARVNDCNDTIASDFGSHAAADAS